VLSPATAQKKGKPVKACPCRVVIYCLEGNDILSLWPLLAIGNGELH